MRARLAACAVAALGAALAVGGSPASACGCGIAIDATVARERALIVEHHHGESIVLSLDLVSDDPAGRAAVVVPVPGEPDVAAIERGDPLAYLERATAPPASGGSGDDGSGGMTAAGRVDVIGREEIGGYDVARLGSADGAALQRWLDRNGYTLPAGAEPILSDYADGGWRFVAIRLPEGSEGALKPLKISFPADETVYPMRLEQLATQPLSLTLFVLARGERRVKGLERTWSGRVDELDPPPPADLRALLGADRHLTRMDADALAPARFAKDLVIEPVPGPPGGDGAGEGRDDDGLSTLGFWIIAAGGFVVLCAVFAIQTRRRPG